ncbi:MAG: nucleotidyltransferase domain-containing protein [Bacteroidota bacterium]
MPGKQDFIAADSPSYQVLVPLLYFEIFSYPLTVDEILSFSPSPSLSKSAVLKAIDELKREGCLYQIEEFYLTHNNLEWVTQRKDNNKRARQYLRKAQMMSQLIRRFPYVKGVLLSGSLSKQVMPKGGDIDYFIITQPQRLWIARSLLVIFKKVFLLNSKKYFCVNYFVDENHLEIEEKNRFTATEVATLLPVWGSGEYDRFYAANDWMKEYFPNYPKRKKENMLPQKRSIVQSSLEYLMNGKFGDWLEEFFMKKTIQHWRRKFHSMDSDSFAVALKSKPYVSKHHPQNFQARVLKAYHDCIQSFEQRNNVQMERPFFFRIK